MTSWSNGYVNDIEYLPGFYIQQTPGHIQLACLIKGYEPPLSSPHFTYCELGCGQGTTANVIAAANPYAHVVAIDFNPAHIARAQRNAVEYGLNNIEFLELSFGELLHKNSLKNFDIVSLHGVWSWISHNDRMAIVSFLKEAVKPGGIVYLSYNSMPGWTPILPFQRLLLEHSRLNIERSDKRVVTSLDFIEKIKELGCSSLGDTKFLARFRPSEKMRETEDQAIYLAHEYLNENWQPLYHADTARMLEEAKLNFVASATILDNFDDLVLTPEQREISTQFPKGIMQETIKDYFVNRPFRRDIFIRGAQKISDSRRESLLGDIGLALTVEQSEAKFTIKALAGEATLPKEQYEPIFRFLAETPRTLKDVAEFLDCERLEKRPSVVEIAGILVGTNQAMPLPWGIDLKKDFSTQFFNHKIVQSIILEESSIIALASPLSGSGLNLNALEATIYYLSASGLSGEDLRQQSLKLISKSKRPLLIDGEVVANPEELEKRLSEAISWCINNRVNIWKNLLML